MRSTDEDDDRPTIIQALGMWGEWHADVSPLGQTGDYALDMMLADAFRALLYRRDLASRLTWIERELRRPSKRQPDRPYAAELMKWWLDLFEAQKMPILEQRRDARRTLCVSY